MEEKPFNLHRVIRGVLDTSPDPNPHNLVFEVFNLIPAAQREAALLAALPQVIRVEANRDRRESMRSPAQQKANPSWSPLVQAARRDPYAIRVWVGKGEWKHLGDLQLADVDFLIAQGEALEKAAKHKQEKYKKIKQAMIQAGATYLKEVSSAVMLPLVQGEV